LTVTVRKVPVMTISARTPRTRLPLALMYVGAALTVVAAVFPFVDRATTTVLADHVRAGYPTYGQGKIDAAVTAYTVILAVVGALGLGGWFGTIRAVRAQKRWARPLAAGLLVGALSVAVAALTVQDTSGDVGVAPLMAWLLVVPCVPGLAACVLLWRGSR
jgi:hypothetical protein